nr:hypothetical protein [Streptomyces sp. CB03234]
MSKRIVGVLVSAAALASVMSGTATAAPAGTPAPSPAAQSCDGVKLSGSLPAPPAGLAVVQDVTIGEDCKPVLGKVRYVPATDAPAGAKAARSAAAPASREGARSAAADTDGTRTFRSWNEMFDCCNIRMTGLYTTSTFSTAGGRVSSATTEARQEWNREPWNAGWNLASSSKTDDCVTDCSVVNSAAHAEFTYKGVFDAFGGWYANSHDSYVQLNADSSATCTFDVELKHTFIGWNWQRGCE